MRRPRQEHEKILLAILIILIVLILLSVVFFWISSRTEKEVWISEQGTLELCFSMQENCTARLESILLDAGSIKAALYDLDQDELISALKSKNADILLDEDNYFGLGQKISGTGLMHDKFWLIYNASGHDYLITGSTNPTYNDLNKNDNNMLIIESRHLMMNYEDEFSELKKSSPDKPTKFQKIIFNGNTLENYFCPEDGA